MGFGWHDTLSQNPLLSQGFYGSTVFNPSSYKAETMAILTVIMVAKNNCKITINTDPQNFIDLYLKISVSDRKLLNIKNYLIWRLMKYLVTLKSSTLDL